MENKLQAVLFDVDGTLADTEEIHRQAFNTAFKQAGLDWHWSQLLYCELLAVTGGKERIRHFISTHKPVVPVSGDPGDFIAKLHQVKTEEFIHTLSEEGIRPRPGVKRLLNEIREAGIRLAIVTTTSPANVDSVLEQSIDPEAKSWFDVIAAGSMVSRKKPAADIYEYALEKLGVAAQHCIAVEDSRNGLRSSMAAGVATLVTVNTYTQGEDFSGAQVLLDHLGEPDRPCTVLDGSLGGKRYVGVPILRNLHAQSLQPGLNRDS